jgi:hypothetical protein
MIGAELALPAPERNPRRGSIMADNKGKKVTHCMLCGKVSDQSICETCQIRVQGEALEHKQGIEKKGKTDTGRA